MQPLIGSGLCIRPFQEEDGPAFVDAVHESLDTVGVWMSWCHEDFSLLEALIWFGECGKTASRLRLRFRHFFCGTGRVLRRHRDQPDQPRAPNRQHRLLG